MSSAKRIGYIDIAKAIAVAFIVIGHTGLVFSADTMAGGMPSWIVRFAFTFHLPVFFIASGYFLRLDTKLDGAYLLKNLRGLIAPYALTCALIVISATLVGLTTSPEEALFQAKRWVKAALWGAGATSPVALWQTERIGGVWFLLALFWARLLITATRRLPDTARWAVVLVAMAGAVWSAGYVWLPLSIQSGLGCAAYVLLGAYIRKWGLFDRRLPVALWVAFVVLWVICIVWGGRASLATCVYPLGVVDILGGVAACFCIMALSKAVERRTPVPSRFLQWVGRNTLPLFALHILEDNILSWGSWGVQLAALTGGAWWTWLVLLVGRFCVDAVLTGIAYVVPGVRLVYFPQLVKTRRGELSKPDRVA